MALWHQQLRSYCTNLCRSFALLMLASCADQGLTVPSAVITENSLDLAPYVGVYGGELPDNMPIYIEAWPQHPEDGYHFLSFLIQSDGKWTVADLAGPVVVQQAAGGALLAQIALAEFYWLDLIRIDDDGILWSPLNAKPSELESLKKQHGLFGSDGKYAHPLRPDAVARYLSAAKAGAQASRFTRITRNDAAWTTYLEQRELALDRYRYQLDGRIRKAQAAGGELPGAKEIATVVTMREYGDLWATYMMARWHYNGWFVEKNATLARLLAEEAIAAGYRRAASLLGVLALTGTGQPVDEAEARAHFQVAADAGEALAMTNLALLDLSSEDKAARYRGIAGLEAAAATGEPFAANHLGKLYLDGDIVAQDDAAARRLFEIAADYEFVDAAFYLGLLRKQGRGGKRDEAGAFTAYTKAAGLGSLSAKYNLGLLYLMGEGTEQNVTKAAALFREAADAGNVDAMGMLAYSLETGQGIQRDDKEAAALYRRCAAEQKAYCQWRLGQMMEEGRGVARDPQQARVLLEQAVAGGEKRAEQALAKLNDRASVKSPGSAAGAGTMAVDSSLFRRPHYMVALAAGKGLAVDDDVMGYLSGLLELYLPNCAWPGSKAELATVVQFYQATTQRALTNAFAMQNIVENTAAFASAANDGKADLRQFAEAYGCELSPQSRGLAIGIIKTASVTGAAGRPSQFVTSCAGSRLNEQQCTCLAELGRGVDPQIDQRTYDSRSTIKSIINRNPMLGLTIALQCGIGDY